MLTYFCLFASAYLWKQYTSTNNDLGPHGCIDWKYAISVTETHTHTETQAVLYKEPVSASPTLTPDCRLYSIAPPQTSCKKMKIALREWKSQKGSPGWIGARRGLSEHWQPVLYGEVGHTGHSGRDRGDKECVDGGYTRLQVGFRWTPFTSTTDECVRPQGLNQCSYNNGF